MSNLYHILMESARFAIFNLFIKNKRVMPILEVAGGMGGREARDAWAACESWVACEACLAMEIMLASERMQALLVAMVAMTFQSSMHSCSLHFCCVFMNNACGFRLKLELESEILWI